MAVKNKNWLLMVILILVGAVIGGFIGEYIGSNPTFSWLRYGQSLGMSTPFTIDLSILTITFGATLKLTIAGIIGIVIALFGYRFI